MDKLRDALASIPDIDQEIIDWLVTINEYSGVYTLNSCAGHADRDGRDAPFVVLGFTEAKSFYRFCRLVSPFGDDSSPMVALWPGKKMITVSPPSKVKVEGLAEVREKLFARVIATLERMKRKASDKEVETKARLVRKYATQGC